MKRIFFVVSLLLASLPASFGLMSPAHAAERPPAKIAAGLWQATANNGLSDVIITAPGYPDLTPARSLLSKTAKTQFVVETLIAFANTAQAELRQDLQTQNRDFFVLWAANQIALKNATRADLLALAQRSDVARVEADVKVKGLEMANVERRVTSESALFAHRHSPFATFAEWGVQRVNAPQVWAQGFIGQGIVVADLDTGARWDHDALKPSYRGWDGLTVTHNYNWFDPVAFSPAAFDDHGHGTHTTGTIVGKDGNGNEVGVAPGATWIACRNMNAGFGSVSLYAACFQFALAPTNVSGNNPDYAKAADITSNSWGCAFNEPGCLQPAALVTVTQALREAGIMVVASAGNSGSSCGSVNNAPATLNQSFTIGATDNGNGIAGFSSRGPSSFTARLKPDVVAPGVGVRSSLRNAPNAYGSFSGTSMAAPHVAGVVALLWSAVPSLRGDIDATEELLRKTATPITTAELCGSVAAGQSPNNTFGYGLINAQAAVQTALSNTLSLRTDAPTTARVGEIVTVTLAISTARVLTDTTLVVSLPVSMSFLSATPTALTQGSVISWEVLSLAAGFPFTFTFSANTIARCQCVLLLSVTQAGRPLGWSGAPHQINITSVSNYLFPLLLGE